MLKYNIRFGWDLKRFYCHGCKELLVPGVNARVRVDGGYVLTTCSACGRVNRKPTAALATKRPGGASQWQTER